MTNANNSNLIDPQGLCSEASTIDYTGKLRLDVQVWMVLPRVCVHKSSLSLELCRVQRRNQIRFNVVNSDNIGL